MVKAGFLKTIKNNMSFSKSFIILGLLVILTIVLFSSHNKYSIENLTPKPNIKAEVYLWVDPRPYGSTHNDLVLRWLDFTKEYGNIPNITLGRGKASEFTKYLELDKYPELNIDTNESLRPLKSVDLTKDTKLVPFISVFFVGTEQGKAYKKPLGLVTGKEVSYDNISKTINGISAMFYDSLYDSDVNVAPTIPAIPKIPVPETSKEIPAIPKATPTATPSMSSMFKFPGS